MSMLLGAYCVWVVVGWGWTALSWYQVRNRFDWFLLRLFGIVCLVIGPLLPIAWALDDWRMRRKWEIL